MPAAVKQGLRELPPDGVGHFGYAVTFDHLPDWYRLYSILPGPPSHCDYRDQVRFPGGARNIAISNCSGATDDEIGKLADKVRAGVDAVEARFGERMHVGKIELVLIGMKDGYRLRHTQRLGRDRIAFRAAFPFDPSAPDNSERGIVRTTAHELFHMAWIVVGRDEQPIDPAAPSEELRASLFESCVEQEVFGSIGKRGLAADHQFDPAWLRNASFAHHSAQSGLEAYRMLSGVVGDDGVISTATERSRFDELCRRLIEE